jgi:hypothetical protein
MKTNATPFLPAGPSAAGQSHPARRLDDPTHKFHGPAAPRDARADVAASGNRQRLRAHRPGSRS